MPIVRGGAFEVLRGKLASKVNSKSHNFLHEFSCSSIFSYFLRAKLVWIRLMVVVNGIH